MYDAFTASYDCDDKSNKEKMTKGHKNYNATFKPLKKKSIIFYAALDHDLMLESTEDITPINKRRWDKDEQKIPVEMVYDGCSK